MVLVRGWRLISNYYRITSSLTEISATSLPGNRVL